MEKIIFHIDVNNAFLSWTAVYLLKAGYKRDIRKIPSIIGGDESKRHGIVLAKSPIAKKFGVVTAETLYQARKKCPNIEIFSPNYNWYYEKSNELFNYLCQYTPNIERFSVDEAFLDMTGTNHLYNDYIQLAYKIKDEIKLKFNYTVNVGIGNNKLCAKMASDFEKPDKVHTLFEHEIKEKMWPLPVGELFMVGKKTSEKLNRLNIKTIRDLAETNINYLKKNFKNQAEFLKNSANGIDHSKVEVKNAKNASISISETLPFDYEDLEKLKEILFRQSSEVGRQLRNKKKYTRTIAVIYKNNLFQSYSRQTKLEIPTNKSEEIYKTAALILQQTWKDDAIRLIGIRLTDFTDTLESQISLFETNKKETTKEDNFQEIIDTINNKFGNNAVIPASIKKIGVSREKMKKIKKS